MDNLVKILNQNKLKATPQRIAIYNYLLHTTTHPNAETIYNALKDDYPAMSLATVYKTVASLRDVQLVQELNVGEDSFRYDACMDNHAHIICRNCHKVDDYKKEIDLSSTISNVEKESGFSIDDSLTFFYGLCKDCR